MVTVCNNSGEDLVVQSLAFDKDNLLKDLNILPNQKMVSLSTISPSKDSIFFLINSHLLEKMMKIIN